MRITSEQKIVGNGWACIIKHNAAAILKIETDDGITILPYFQTNVTSENVIHNICQTSVSVKHRFTFSVPIPPNASYLVFSLQIPGTNDFKRWTIIYFSVGIPSSIEFSDYKNSIRNILFESSSPPSSTESLTPAANTCTLLNKREYKQDKTCAYSSKKKLKNCIPKNSYFKFNCATTTHKTECSSNGIAKEV